MLQTQNNSNSYFLVQKAESSDSVIITGDQLQAGRYDHNGNVENEKNIKTEVLEEINVNNYTLKEEQTDQKIEKQILVEECILAEKNHIQPIDYFCIPKTESSESIIIDSNAETQLEEKCYEHDNNVDQQTSIIIEVIEQINDNEGTLYKILPEEKMEKRIIVERNINKNLRSRSTKQVHIRTHAGDTSFVCSKSGKAFSKRYRLHTRLRMHSGEKKYACVRCGKSFARCNDLVRHNRTHTGDKPYVCNICAKKFASSSNLQCHLRTHSDEKKYACDQCSKKYTQSSHLVYHIRSHTGEKPYVCNLCEKKFASSSNLKSHLRTHSNGKEYFCDQCNKKFNRHSSLILHNRTHTREKPSACNKCEKKYTSLSNFESHMKIYSDEKEYACERCDKSKRFNSCGDLVHRIQAHTGDKRTHSD